MNGFSEAEIEKATKLIFWWWQFKRTQLYSKVGLAVIYGLGLQKCHTDKLTAYPDTVLFLSLGLVMLLVFVLNQKHAQFACQIFFEHCSWWTILPNKLDWFQWCNGGCHCTVNVHWYYDISAFKVYIDTIVSNNDSTLRARMQYASGWSNLPDHVHAPSFLSNPIHCIKVMVLPIF